MQRALTDVLLATLLLAASQGYTSDPPIEMVAIPDDDHFFLVILNVGEEAVCIEEVSLHINTNAEILKDGGVFEEYRGTAANVHRWPDQVRLMPSYLTGLRVSKDLVSLFYDVDQGDIIRFSYYSRSGSDGEMTECARFTGMIYSDEVEFDWPHGH